MIVRKGRWSKNELNGFLFVAPLLIGIGLFSVYPMLDALLLSFRDNRGVVLDSWTGLSNYRYVLTDNVFWKSLYNTAYMGVLSVALGTILPFILATLINSLLSNRLQSLFKAIYFLPNVVSVVATSILFTFLFYPSSEGIINYLLHMLGLSPVGWFTDPAFSRFSIVILGLWASLGYNTIIYIAGLQSVPRDLFEAAEMDGAGRFKQWKYITIPYMRNIFFFMIVIGTINALKRFTEVWLIGGTAGNPDSSLLTTVMYIYRNAFLANQMGVASAASYLLFLFIFGLTFLFLVMNRNKHLTE